MTTEFVDSAAAPTLAQARNVKALGYTGWGGYMAGATPHIWTPAEVSVVLELGFSFLPIVVPPLDLSGLTRDLVTEGLAQMMRCGVDGALCLDTESVERDNPYLKTWVDAFLNHTRQAGLHPVIYDGGGYAGDGHLWLPDWTASAGTKGPKPASGWEPNGARQWAGNIELVSGILVDLSLAGPFFPFAHRT
jgi:hypothetical protein